MQIEIALSRFREFRTHRESIGRSRYGSPGSQLLSRAEPFSTFWRRRPCVASARALATRHCTKISQLRYRSCRLQNRFTGLPG